MSVSTPTAVDKATDIQKNTSTNVSRCSGRSYACACDKNSLAGLIALVIASVMLIFGCVLASGVFGGGTMAFIAAGLAVGSMLGFGAAIFFLAAIPKK